MYDFGSRGNVWETDDGESELRYVPRALWWGFEWSRYALHRLWHLPEPPEPLLRGVRVRKMFDEQLNVLPKKLAKRLKYYRPYVAEGLTELRLRTFYAQTEFDGRKVASTHPQPSRCLAKLSTALALGPVSIPAAVPGSLWGDARRVPARGV